jgi:hypothetical protein
MAGFVSERVAGFILECLAGFVGILKQMADKPNAIRTDGLNCGHEVFLLRLPTLCVTPGQEVKLAAAFRHSESRVAGP